MHLGDDCIIGSNKCLVQSLAEYLITRDELLVTTMHSSIKNGGKLQNKVIRVEEHRRMLVVLDMQNCRGRHRGSIDDAVTALCYSLRLCRDARLHWSVGVVGGSIRSADSSFEADV
jgi:hypothetical protein